MNPPNEDVQLMRWLGAHRSAVSGGSATDHPDVDTLSRHATAQLSPGKARIVSEHLMVCEDGRCLAFVRSSAEDVDAAAAVLYPAGEAKGMHARTFLCREALWEAFEQMAREQGAPVDELLSEAMRSYARQRSYQSVQQAPAAPPSYEPPQTAAHDYDADADDELARTGMIRQPAAARPMAMSPPMIAGRPSPSQVGGPLPRPQNVSTTRGVAPPHAPPPPRQSAPLPEPPGRVPLQRPFTAPIGQQLPAPPAPPPGRGGPPRFPTGPGAASGGFPAPPPRGGGGAVPPPPRSMPPPLPPSDPHMPAYGAPQQRGRVATQLTLTYQNRSVEVTKDRFLLGRSKSQADLVLDDANVSRQHAAIERVGDTWVLADLGSTNGCYVDGQRVSRRQLVDGDVIEITTHQVRCTLR